MDSAILEESWEFPLILEFYVSFLPIYLFLHKFRCTCAHARTQTHTHTQNSLSSSSDMATYCVDLYELPNLSESVSSSGKWAQIWTVHGRENLMN